MDFSQWTGPSSEWKAFAKANPTLVAPANNKLPIPEQQARGNTARVTLSDARLGQAGLDQLVETGDYSVPVRDGQSIPVRTYRPKSPAVPTASLPGYVYLHGGGFLCGTLETERFECSSLANDLAICVIHICYRSTPQFKGLTAWYDTIDGFEWIVANASRLALDSSRLIVGGISAGGMLAACLVQHEMRRSKEKAEEIRIKGQILGVPNLVHRDMYPYHLFTDNVSFRMPNSALLTLDRINIYTDLLEGNPQDPFWNPALVDEAELCGMPKTALLVCGNDPLRDEALLYASKLRAASVPNRVHIFDGMPHVSFIRFPQLLSTTQWDEAMRGSIHWALENSQAIEEEDWNVHKAPPMQTPAQL